MDDIVDIEGELHVIQCFGILLVDTGKERLEIFVSGQHADGCFNGIHIAMSI